MIDIVDVEGQGVGVNSVTWIVFEESTRARTWPQHLSPAPSLISSLWQLDTWHHHSALLLCLLLSQPRMSGREKQYYNNDHDDSLSFSLWSCLKNAVRKKKCTCHLNYPGINDKYISNVVKEKEKCTLKDCFPWIRKMQKNIFLQSSLMESSNLRVL